MSIVLSVQNKKQKTFNSQVFSIACSRLKLKRREKTILYRLLGFLIERDNPLIYSVKSLSNLTGYSRSSIFESFNILETLRLIQRIGFTSRVKYIKGSILIRICTLVQIRINKSQVNNDALVQKLDNISLTSPVSGYQKTSFSLKRKEEIIIYNEKYQEYVGNIKRDVFLGIIDKSSKWLSYEEWMLFNKEQRIC